MVKTMRKKAIITLTTAVIGLKYLLRVLWDMWKEYRYWGSSYSLAADLSKLLNGSRSLLAIAAVSGQQPETIRAIINQLVTESKGIWSYQQAADIVERYAMQTGSLPAGLDFNDRDFYAAALASGHIQVVRPEDVKVVVSAVWIKQGYGYHFSAN